MLLNFEYVSIDMEIDIAQVTNFSKNLFKEHFVSIISLLFTVLVGFIFKIPKFFKLLYYIRAYSRGEKKVISKIVQILELIGVPSEITQSFSKSSKTFDRAMYSRDEAIGVYWLIVPLHDGDKGPFCPTCAEKDGNVIHLIKGDPAYYDRNPNVLLCNACGFSSTKKSAFNWSFN